MVGDEAPTIAGMSNPDSIRARFGKSMVENAVYCTRSAKAFDILATQFFYELKAMTRKKASGGGSVMSDAYTTISGASGTSSGSMYVCLSV